MCHKSAIGWKMSQKICFCIYLMYPKSLEYKIAYIKNVGTIQSGKSTFSNFVVHLKIFCRVANVCRLKVKSVDHYNAITMC